MTCNACGEKFSTGQIVSRGMHPACEVWVADWRKGIVVKPVWLTQRGEFCYQYACDRGYAPDTDLMFYFDSLGKDKQISWTKILEDLNAHSRNLRCALTAR